MRRMATPEASAPAQHAADGSTTPEANSPARGETDGLAVLLQASSLLLSYPASDCADELELVADALTELPRTTPRRRLERFLDWWRSLEAREREQIYVESFDLNPGLSLYLTEGEPRTSRERGSALLELKEAYRHSGVMVRCGELPDHLPLMLEAAAQAPACRALLADRRVAVQALATSLQRRGSPFSLILEAVLDSIPANPRGKHPANSSDRRSANSGDMRQASSSERRPANSSGRRSANSSGCAPKAPQ